MVARLVPFGLILGMLAGCASTPIVRPVSLPLPTRPVLTPVAPSQLMCLSDQTYTTLVKRERALKTWGLEMEAVIDANNRRAHP